MSTQPETQREFLKTIGRGLGLGAALRSAPALIAQTPGDRPQRSGQITVLNPRDRIPVGLIIDDSSCLVNVNHFAVPQFAEAWGGKPYTHNWRDWPREIPDAFVRRFGEWCAEHGVKGKYSIVPYPACVGRLDRGLPGWSQRELRESLDLVRTVMMPNWDIHPEMVTHTRVIDIKTGHPYEDHSLKFMENWEWTTGRSTDEIADYLAYALRILRNVGLPCEGVTTPGGFGNRALPQLAQATLQSVRDVFKADIPHYFRHLYDKGNESVAPRVEYASGLQTADPRCVVSIIACTGDWTGGWDNTPPGGVDKFITPDLQSGRLVDVIKRGEPALMLAHWTGIHFNGEEVGFKIFKEVVRRLHERRDPIIWMKLNEVARYWAAKELTSTQLSANGDSVRLIAPFACKDFTLSLPKRAVRLEAQGQVTPLQETASRAFLKAGAWHNAGNSTIVCVDLPKGESKLILG